VGHLLQSVSSTVLSQNKKERCVYEHTRHLRERGVNQHHTQADGDEAPKEERRASVSENEGEYAGLLVSITHN